MIRLIASLFSNLALLGIFGFAGMVAVIRGYASDLPSHDELRNYQPAMLSRVYSGEGNVIAEFARERRVFVPIDEVPELVKQAFISAEDKNFYEHAGFDLRAIAAAIYEAIQTRGETVRGMFAVAEVILNRVDSRYFPNSVCGVVNQGTGRKFACQFTYTCDGKLETINNQTAWQNVGKVASLSIAMDRRPLTFGATYYHTNYVSPSWSKKFARTASIGVHYFYKEPDRISSN